MTDIPSVDLLENHLILWFSHNRKGYETVSTESAWGRRVPHTHRARVMEKTSRSLARLRDRINVKLPQIKVWLTLTCGVGAVDQHWLTEERGTEGERERESPPVARAHRARSVHRTFKHGETLWQYTASITPPPPPASSSPLTPPPLSSSPSSLLSPVPWWPGRMEKLSASLSEISWSPLALPLDAVVSKFRLPTLVRLAHGKRLSPVRPRPAWPNQLLAPSLVGFFPRSC